MAIAILIRFEFALYALFIIILFVAYLIRKRFRFKNLVYFLLSASLVYSLYAVPLYIYSGFKVISPYIGDKIFSEKLPDKPNHNIENYKKMDLIARAVLFNNNTAINTYLPKQTKVKVSQEDWESFPPQGEKNSQKRTLISRNYKRLFQSILPSLFRWHLIGFLLAGVFYCIHKKVISSLFLYALVMMTLLIFPLGSVDSPRYYMHLQPFLLIIASCGIYFLATTLRNITGFRMIFPLVVLVIIGIYFCNDIRSLNSSYTQQDLVWLKSAEYLKENAEENSIVMARKKFAAFYSNMRMAILPDEQNLNDVWEYANHIKADYLIIDNKLTATLMPQYKSLLEDEIPLFIELKKEFFKGTEYFTRIFKFSHRNFREQ